MGYHPLTLQIMLAWGSSPKGVSFTTVFVCSASHVNLTWSSFVPFTSSFRFALQVGLDGDFEIKVGSESLRFQSEAPEVTD